MKNRFAHLQKTETVDFDWANNILKKSLPSRAFTNNLTSGLILSSEKMLGASMSTIKRLYSWYSL